MIQGGSSTAAVNYGVNEENESSGSEQQSRIETLAKGGLVWVEIDPNAMLCKVLDALGDKTEPVFTSVDCGGKGERFAIKFKSAALADEFGERHSIFVGETSSNTKNARMSAVLKVFKVMEEKHHICIKDFSSSLVEIYERIYTRETLFDATCCVEKVIYEWENTLEKSEELTNGLLLKENNEINLATLTHIGEIYAAAAKPFRDILDELHAKKNEAKKDIDDMEEERARLAPKLIERSQKKTKMADHRQVDLETKYVLGYALDFLGFEKARYTNEPGGDAMVHTSVEFCIPYMGIYKYGGNIKLMAKGKNVKESENRAAFEALLFIESNFRIKVADYNYQDRTEAINFEEKLVEMITKVLEVATDVKLMWGSLGNVVNSQKALFKHDPTMLFTGTSAQGKANAFRECEEAVNELLKYSEDAYKNCLPSFERLEKIKWSVINNRIGLPY